MTQPEEDDPLIAELRDLFDQADPVPPLVIEAARASLGWRRLDAELAELLSDSAVDERELSLARGDTASARSVSFSAGVTTIDMEIHVDGDQRTLLGQLSPATTATIEVQRAVGSLLAVAESDELGRFRARLSGAATIRLRVSAGTRRPVETAWIPI